MRRFRDFPIVEDWMTEYWNFGKIKTFHNF
jgi:hypothetical protein